MLCHHHVNDWMFRYIMNSFRLSPRGCHTHTWHCTMCRFETCHWYSSFQYRVCSDRACSTFTERRANFVPTILTVRVFSPGSSRPHPTCRVSFINRVIITIMIINTKFWWCSFQCIFSCCQVFAGNAVNQCPNVEFSVFILSLQHYTSFAMFK